MSHNNPELLDQLAAGLDAGWDTPSTTEAEPIEGAPSQGRLSVAPSENAQALDAVDADWDVVGQSQHSGKPDARPAEPSLERFGAAPARVSKQDRRDAERKRQAHQAQRRAANKQERKLERQEEARRASEQLRAQQRAEAEQRASRAAAAASAKAVEARAPASNPKRLAKQARRQPLASAPRSASVTPGGASVTPGSAPVTPGRPAAVVLDRGAKKLIPLLAIALAVGVSLGFALLRAH